MKHLKQAADSTNVLRVEISTRLDLDLTGTGDRTLGHALDMAGIKVKEYSKRDYVYTVEFTNNTGANRTQIKSKFRRCLKEHFVFLKTPGFGKAFDELITVGDPRY